jgi:AhpD family alkylhydroperoxidase
VSALTTLEHPRLELRRATPHPYRALAALGNSVELDARLRELVNVRASMVNGCAYCINMHTKNARAAGEIEQRLYALAAWQEAPYFDDKERAALALTDAVTSIADGHVRREIWDEASSQFEPDELAHLVWAITLINAWNRIAITTRMQPE